jgi:hypothetical protein
MLILFGGIFGLIGGILIFGKQKRGISLAYFGIFNFALNAMVLANIISVKNVCNYSAELFGDSEEATPVRIPQHLK